MISKTVGTIVVTFNRKKMLKECIENLLKQTYKNQEILIIDNASTDGTKEYIEKLIDDKKVFYINTGKNMGGAGGFNFGVREAMKRGYDYLWLMDDDTIADDKNALKVLVEKAALLKDDFSFLAGLVKWTDGSLCAMNIPKFDEHGWHDKYSLFKEEIVPIETSTFVSFFANAKIVKKAGLPIKDFFIYGDDWEYCLRMRQFAQPYMVTNSFVTHKMAVNSNASIVECPAERIKRCYYDYRNQGFVIRKYGKKKDKMRRKYLYFAFVWNILVRAENKRFKRLHTLNMGYFKGMFFNPKIEKL